MSAVNIVLPPLTKLTENMIVDIFNAKSQVDTDNILEKFFSKHTAICLNGKKVSRKDLFEELIDEKLLEASASVRILGAVEGENEAPANQALSLVGWPLFSFKFR